MQLTALKCHGSFNHFILIDEDKLASPLTTSNYRQLSQLLSQHYQTDGVLFFSTLSATTNPKDSCSKSDCQMLMFNPDGSEAQMCGNGLRCAARYGMAKYQVSSLAIKTPQRVLKTRKTADIFHDVAGFETEIAPVSLTIPSMQLPHQSCYPSPSSQLPQWINQPLSIVDELPNDIRYTALSVPNPHLIGICPQKAPVIEQDKVVKAWQRINQTNWFPEGINLSIVKVLPATLTGKQQNQLYVITCERGVGPTNACGTAMAASTLTAAIHQTINPKWSTQVINLGGFVQVQLPPIESLIQEISNTTTLTNADNIDPILLTGNATWVWQKQLSVDLSSQSIQQLSHQDYPKEQQCYATLQQYAQRQL